MTKDWYKSKMLWFNLLAGVVALVSEYGFAEFEPDPSVYPIVAGVVAVINIVLRVWFTETRLTA